MTPADSTPICRTCGMPLPGGKWSSACPRCLIEAFGEEEKARTDEGLVAGYTILEEVARGGMGIVYRAQQHRPSRVVALKRILSFQANPEETLLRFRREAEAVAALDHPNILPIYEVGESADGLPFFSMKFATGGSLRDAAPAIEARPNECGRLLAKVARAIAHAHEHGILHRDLQPGNILLDGNGEPLVSDFGLAKWLDDESSLTKTLTAFGTPGYIAPEQAEGAELTPAADIYSLGAILFNLLAHRPPFVGATVLSVIHQAAASSAPKLRSLVPSVDRDLETIVARCLEREPHARYQSARALAEDLERWLEGRPILARHVRPPARIWRWSRRNPSLATAATTCVILAFALAWLLRDQSGPPPRIPPPATSIAVLPFANRSGEPENVWFAQGIEDGIVARLSKIADLKVISRSSTERFKSAPDKVGEIAQQLGVEHILKGSVSRFPETMSVTVQLIHAPSETQLWTETYDRKLTDVFTVESEIAQRVTTALAAALSGRKQGALQARLATKPVDKVSTPGSPASGTFYWTTFGSNNAYGYGSFSWDGSSLSATTTQRAPLASFSVDGSIVVGADGNIYSGRAGRVSQINPSSGKVVSVDAGANNNVISIDRARTTVFVGWKDTRLASLATGTSFGPGTPHNLSGDDTVASGLAWDNNGKVWYTTGGENVPGNVGTIDLATYTTTRRLSAISATSIAFDPFTGHIFTAGINGVVQIDPVTGTVVSNWVNPRGAGLYILGLAPTGKGHLIALDTNGLLRIWDFSSGSKLIGSSDTIQGTCNTPVIDGGLAFATLPDFPVTTNGR